MCAKYSLQSNSAYIQQYKNHYNKQFHNIHPIIILMLKRTFWMCLFIVCWIVEMWNLEICDESWKEWMGMTVWFSPLNNISQTRSENENRLKMLECKKKKANISISVEQFLNVVRQYDDVKRIQFHFTVKKRLNVMVLGSNIRAVLVFFSIFEMFFFFSFLLFSSPLITDTAEWRTKGRL